MQSMRRRAVQAEAPLHEQGAGQKLTSSLPRAPMPSLVIHRMLAAAPAAWPAPALMPTAASRLDVMSDPPSQPVMCDGTAHN